MWSETLGLMTRPVSDQKIGLGLARCGLVLGLGLVMCCEKRSCYARRHNDLEGHSNFSSTIWNITTVEVNSCVYLLKVESAKCLCLLPVVLILVLVLLVLVLVLIKEFGLVYITGAGHRCLQIIVVFLR